MGLSELSNKVKNGAKSIGNSFKNAFKEIKEELQTLDKNISDKQTIKEEFEKQAVKYEILGKTGFLSDKKYIYGINDFRIMKKEIYFRSSDNLDDILVGTILVDGDKRYEIKELYKSEVRYYTLEYPSAEDSTKKLEAEISCVVATVKAQ